MIILGIESSCDETGVAVLRDGKIVVDIISSQITVHGRFGGVVPEYASRMQLEAIGHLTEQACREAHIRLQDVDGIAVTIGPGLIGSVLVGLNFAKGIAYAIDKPLIGIDHVQAHLFSPMIEFPDIHFPYVGLVVSGGHTELYTVKDFREVELKGKTVDDAAGEAYDKVSKSLGLGYPGGPVIDNISMQSKIQKKIKFPMALMIKDNYNFSFSGIKTAVIRHIKKIEQPLKQEDTTLIASSFQEAVQNVLVKKTIALAEQTGINSIAVSGGVAANSRLRQLFDEYKKSFNVYIPRTDLCTDNGSMIAFLGYQLYKLGKVSNINIDGYANNTRIPEGT
ncbi:MAG: tRNA (adenosine(37)-N6)-threonylcarbamoyltransferase complex transferase subunit TsaD [Deltaproteobacteria bacterium]|nr:tRNA (adenosine(37)-N6)-threonylcarbamoyltransferase complex transferase subunit TsaD [Deltaproteobacteria bacterium]MCL5791932.1 tRNA (adenosine(37)-N6)-threonylcarbamoyltransferase complex transferase subunit TsaD [Deltaproteobacteria bacterium]